MIVGFCDRPVGLNVPEIGFFVGLLVGFCVGLIVGLYDGLVVGFTVTPSED